MKFEFLRLGGARLQKDAGASNESVQWLPRNRVRAKRPGDFAIVLLASGVVVLLGMVLVIARYGPAQAEATAGVAQVEPARKAEPDKNAAVASADAPQSAPVVAPRALQAEALPRAEIPLRSPPVRNVSETPAPAPVADSSPAAGRKLPMRSSDAEPAIVAQPPAQIPAAAPVTSGNPTIETASIVPRPAAEVDSQLIFGTPVVTSPVIAQPAEAPAPGPEEANADDALPAVAPAPPARPEKLAALAPPPSTAARPAPGKGGSGATWAVWFDEFPDQRSVAAKLNALQGKYGPYLGGRTLTYTRTGKVWRARVSGLTEDLAQSICGKVKSAGAACAVGGRN